MKISSGFFKKYLFATLIYLFILIIVYFQNKYIGFYHDDYGYASLSYGFTPTGGFNFENVMSFLKWHYLHWGGRVLFFFFGVYAMQLGMQGFMLVQSIILSLTLFMAYKLALTLLNETTKAAQIFSVAFILSFYFLINTNIYTNSLFWASASVLYAWPLLCLLTGLYILFNLDNFKIIDFRIYIISGIAFFMAGFSQEQIALAAIGAVPSVAFFALYGKINKYKNVLCVSWISALIGFCFLYMAPGNYVRMVTKNEPLPGLWNILTQFPENTVFILRNIGKLESVLLSVVCIALCISVWRGSATARKLIPIVFLSSIAFSVIYIAPIKGPRLLFPPIFLLSIPLAIYLTQGALKIMKQSFSNIAVLSCAIFFLVSITMHIRLTMYGYYQNYPTILKNDLNLRKIASSLEKPEQILFYKLPHLKFADCMPYDNRPYIEYWIRKYYGVPSDIPFKYMDAQ